MLDQIQISSVHYTLSDTAKKFIEEKLQKLDFMKKIIADGSIKIIRDNEHYKVEANFHLKNKHRIHIDSEDTQLYPVIEKVVHKLKHRLSEEHKKITSHKEPHTSKLHHGEHPILNSDED